ncbi:MAG: phage tail tube protein [Anaerotignum sp.]|nr:phage tail tube protein [Anaerotignum sp.]
MAGNFDAKKAMNGTWGEFILNGIKVAETTALKLEVQMQFQDVPMCGTLAKQQKPAGWTGNGSVTMTKINSRMAILLAEEIKAGRTPEFIGISKLDDPDAWGAERVVAKGIQFSSLILADWSAGNIGTQTYPFTFTDYDFLDLVEVE